MMTGMENDALEIRGDKFTIFTSSSIDVKYAIQDAERILNSLRSSYIVEVTDQARYQSRVDDNKLVFFVEGSCIPRFR